VPSAPQEGNAEGTILTVTAVGTWCGGTALTVL